MTKVALLWHMHQPFYQDLATGEHILPWVRLHGLKDYYGMVALLREFPGVRATFNLVPSLLSQLEALAAGTATDRWLDVGLKPAGALTDAERQFLVGEAFHVPRPRMIDPYPRYAELWLKREQASGGLGTAWRTFGEAELRDLQVWEKLVWMDPLVAAGDPRVAHLLQKGQYFTEDDKQELRRAELELLARIVPEYAAAAARGQVELSSSPFYHPILPLLCDTDIYLRTHPQARLPRQRFRHPGDAQHQLDRAAVYHERVFGRRPAGLWPSEGGVSDAMVPLAAAAGFRWMATDETILARSLGTSLTRDPLGNLEQPEILYRPYTVRAGGAEIACLFRDHLLSDLIGFTYATWDPAAAAEDLIGRLVAAGRQFQARAGGEAAVIPIVLDGENAWEHYPEQGRGFLRAFYGALEKHPELTSVTVSEAVAGPAVPLTGIFPGSWINGDFYIWIGHADDQRAWAQLAEARQTLEAPSPGAGAEAVARAREELLIAEGSDWFWWYGDDHSSPHDLAFDDLFRRHLRNVYVALEKAVPEELYVSNITTEPPRMILHAPRAEVSPVLDGEVTSYFEWLWAGELELGVVFGAMHEVAGPARTRLTGLHYGFDPEHLHLRLDLSRRAQDFLAAAGELRVTFFTPPGLRVAVTGRDGQVAAALLERRAAADWVPRSGPGPTVGVGHVAEISIPLSSLGVAAGEPLALVVAVVQRGQELERHPAHRPLELGVPAADFRARHWSV